MKSKIYFKHVTDYKADDISHYAAGAKDYTIKSLKNPNDPRGEEHYYAHITPTEDGMNNMLIHYNQNGSEYQESIEIKKCSLIREPEYHAGRQSVKVELEFLDDTKNEDVFHYNYRGPISFIDLFMDS